IYSTGSGSIVTVSGGTVSNAAGNNLNPAIYMNTGMEDDVEGVGDPPAASTVYNVIISGGIVASSSNAGYALQTAGNVLVTDGAIAAINGRAINLVGPKSNATIEGGTVTSTGTGTAISSATTNPQTVTQASVTMSGGTVSAISGSAIQVTGASSAVTVSGGTVTATTGNTINATSDAVNAAITITGDAQVSSVSGNAVNAATNAAATTSQKVTVSGTAQVSSSTGRAIQTNGNNSSVTVSDNPRIWVMTRDNAIRSRGTVTLTGGFIFAFGQGGVTGGGYAYVDARPVISARLPSPFSIAAGSSSALIVAWDKDAGNTVYPAGSSTTNDQDLDSSYNGGRNCFYWDVGPGGAGGISYYFKNGDLTTEGFFPLAQVRVMQDFGLIFDVATGNLYEDVLGDRTYSPTYDAPNKNDLWSSSPNPAGGFILNLNGFSWTTGVTPALTIINGDATINLQNGSTSSFISTNPAGTGIWNDDTGIFDTVTTVSAGPFKLTGNGTIEAIGGASALSSKPALPDAYIWWTNSAAAPPAGPGTTFCTGSPVYGTPFVFAETNSYTKISIDCFAVIDNDIVTGKVNNTLAGGQDATITLYGVNTTASPGIIDYEANAWFKDLPLGVIVTATIHVDVGYIDLSFSGTPLQVSQSVFEITIPGDVLANGLPLTVLLNLDARFDITRLPDPGRTGSGGNRGSGAGGGADGSPETSDRSNIEGWTAAMIISALGLLCIFILTGRRKPGTQNR
ncbi:MAG: hypothetical protein FWE68_06270, partial [Defluviitaleaceae bacterium]|nr:hypothetical protein [Defluviitaleaceae bacterium]